MRNLYEIAMQCEEKLKAINIPIREVKEYRVNKRAKKRWGCCWQDVDGKFIVEVNVCLLDERNDISGLENTILHELLHTCKYCQNHGKMWKAYAAAVKAAYGYDIKRTSTSWEKGIAGATRTYSAPRKRQSVRYSTNAVERFIKEEIIPAGYTVFPIAGHWIDSYICIPERENYIYEFKANDDLHDPWYNMRRSRKISKRMEAEINSSVK